MEALRARRRVAICHGPDCSRRNVRELVSCLEGELARRGLCEEVSVRPGACNKLCEEGPSMVVHPDRVWYSHLTPEAIRRIVSEHLAGGEPAREWVAREFGPRDQSFLDFDLSL